jgi:hypothetical protein
VPDAFNTIRGTSIFDSHVLSVQTTPESDQGL